MDPTNSSHAQNAKISLRYELGSDPEMEQGIQKGQLVVATLNVFQRWGNHLIFARNPAFPSDVVVSGADDIGPGYHGDVAAIELFPCDQAHMKARPNDTDGDTDDVEAPAKQVMPARLPDGRPIVASVIGERNDDDEAPRTVTARLCQLLKSPNDERQTWPDGIQRCGRVVKILWRDMDAFVVARPADGVVRPGQFIQSNYQYRFRPYNALLPQVAVRGGDIPAPLHRDLADSLFLLRLNASEKGEPVRAIGDIISATYADCLGTTGSTEANTRAICSEFEIPSETFADDVEACVPDAFVIPDREELKKMGRRDLREEEFVCTIDPATARDLDDALSIRRTTDGGYRVGVHIADVSFFVQPNTPIDEEASKRSTSTYLVDHVIPMLPRKLSEDYCSLNPGEDKFAFSSLFELDRDCHVVSEWFGKSVIRSRCRLAYEEAQQILDDKDVALNLEMESRVTGESPDALLRKVRSSVKLLYEVARKMREESLTRGRLAIPNQKLGFVFDDMNSRLAPKGFVVVNQIAANWVVEEFMLLANTRTAQKIVQYLPQSALLRHHPPPEPKKINILKAATESVGVHLYGSSAAALQRTIDEARANPHFASLCVLLKYSLSAAEYMVNDVESTVPRSHFALGLDWYTHFTSPIRRYSDIIAHRQLLVAVEVEERLRASGAALPSVADPHVQPKAGALSFDVSESIDPQTLRTRDCFYTYTEVDEIAENANLRKENARKAGEQSSQLFFCLYLRAMIKKAEADPRFSPHPCARMTVLRIKGSSMTVYADVIASEIEVGFKDQKQLFTIVVPEANEEELDEPGRPKDNQHGGMNATGESKRILKEQAKRRSKGGKAGLTQREPRSQKESESKERNPTVQLDWGLDPRTNEVCIEELTVFSGITAELLASTSQGAMKLDTIIIPPWLREQAFLQHGNIPTTLE